MLLEVEGRRFGVVICWEAIYAELVDALARDGAELLVNISNDDWFGGEAAMTQHFHAALLRAVETRRTLVRATNSGITAIVDPRGVVAARLPRSEPGVLEATVGTSRAATFYVRWGDVFAWVTVAFVVILLGTVRGERSSDE